MCLTSLIFAGHLKLLFSIQLQRPNRAAPHTAPNLIRGTAQQLVVSDRASPPETRLSLFIVQLWCFLLKFTWSGWGFSGFLIFPQVFDICLLSRLRMSLWNKSVSLLKDKRLDQIKHLCAKRKGILAASPI